MTLAAVMQSDVSSVFMQTGEFAESVIRYVKGDSEHRQSFTAVVDLMQPEFSEERGRGYITRGTVIVDDSVTVSAGDAFDIRGDRYEVVSVKPAAYGIVEASVTRYETEARGVRRAGDL